MSLKYKYQEAFADKLAVEWLSGNQSHVRDTIRGLERRKQAAYICAAVAIAIIHKAEKFKDSVGAEFLNYMHPNN